MKIKIILIGFVTILSGLFFTSCEEYETEFGNTLIFFTKTAPEIPIHAKSSREALSSIPDSTINYINIYRSGDTDNLQEINIRLSVDTETIAGIIKSANETEAIYRTDQMNRYLLCKTGTLDMISIPERVRIPAGDRNVVVPVTLHLGKMLPYEIDYLNYTEAQYSTATVAKDKKLVIGIKIESADGFKVAEDRNICFLEFIDVVTFE